MKEKDKNSYMYFYLYNLQLLILLLMMSCRGCPSDGLQRMPTAIATATTTNECNSDGGVLV